MGFELVRDGVEIEVKVIADEFADGGIFVVAN